MDQVGRPAKIERPAAERVLGPRRHGARQAGILGPGRGRRMPGRVLALAHHRGLAERRVGALPSDADREGPHRPGAVEEVETLFGQVDDDPFARAGRQQVSRRDRQVPAHGRQPGIDIGIGGREFHVTEVVGPCQLDQAVFGRGPVQDRPPDRLLADRRRRRQGPRGLRRGPGGAGAERQAKPQGYREAVPGRGPRAGFQSSFHHRPPPRSDPFPRWSPRCSPRSSPSCCAPIRSRRDAPASRVS